MLWIFSLLILSCGFRLPFAFAQRLTIKAAIAAVVADVALLFVCEVSICLRLRWNGLEENIQVKQQQQQ